MTNKEQLQKWLEGEPIHNKELGVCCPDFSCCRPELLAPREERELLCSLQDDARFRLLGMFLGRAINSKEVYIAGMIEEPKND